MGKMCLGKEVTEISSDQNEGSRDWDSPEYKDTTRSGGMKEPEALVFHKMYTKEDSDRYIAQLKLYLEYEVRKGKKLVKKELMVSLHWEIYFVQFIINPKEYEFEPGLILGRSFLHSANAIVNFREGTITIQPDFDPFLLSTDEEGNPNLNDLEMLLDFDFNEVPQIETDLPPMVCKMGKGNINKNKVMENIMIFHNGAGLSSSVGRPLTKEEDEKRALAYNISMGYGMLEEVRPVDKVKLDGKIKPEEERAIIKVKGQMLKEKKDPGAFIFLIRLEGLINENALADTGSNINTMPYRIYEQCTMSSWIHHSVYQVGFTTRDAPIVIAKSDSDDEEDYVIKRNEMGTPIHNSRPIGYQNNANPAENMTLSTLESVINPFRKISMWKKAVSFLGSLPAKLRDVEWNPNYKLCYANPELATGQWKTEIRLTDPYGNIYMQAFVIKPTKRMLSKFHKLSDIMSPNWFIELQEHTIKRWGHPVPNALEMLKPLKKHYSLMFIMNFWNRELLHKIGYGDEYDKMLKISLREAQTDEEIFFSVAWVRAFNIRDPIYQEFCREFYATYEFDKVCADDELQSKKIINFRLVGRAHSLTLLEFARRLGLYHAEELKEEGFDTYFQGGLRSDEKLNAREYWERISTDRDLHLSRSSITFTSEWVCKCGLGDCKVNEEKGSWESNGKSDLLWTTLGELINSKDRLVLDIPDDDVPRVAAKRVLRVQRASMYQGVFEHMAGVYNVPLQGDYNPPSYAQP
ncbi:hypothetical protein Tco_0769058 [Tanacetum coccineum]|uniref:Uncharacterized protein n=1 Tax=Tanacetum coccineum TaxID=301880 RepID=A0ABQ4ZB68_9ASTR